MAFDGKDSLKLAEFLGGRGGSGYSEEAAYRAAVSRAYFAAFGHALHTEADRGRFRPSGRSDDHARLRAHLLKMDDGESANELETLRIWRNQCDYAKVVIGNLSQIVKDALESAEIVIDKVK